MPKKVEISYKTVVFITVFVAFVWLLFQIRSILLSIFIALILMSVLNPIVRRLEKLKVKRSLSILIVYIGVLTIIILFIGAVVPPLVEQTANLINQIPSLLKQFKVLGIDEKLLAIQLSQFTSLPANLVKLIVSLFSNVLAVIALLIITFYLLVERKNLEKYLILFFGEAKEKEIEGVFDQIEIRLGGWVKGEFLLMLAIGILSFLGYRIIGLNFALPLSLLAFLLEVVPNFGPIVASIPAIIVGLTISPWHGIAVAGWVFLIQQVENSFLVPRIMKKAAGVNPLISIISLAIGFKLAGVGGALLAIPTYLALEVIVAKIYSSKKFDER